jgi:hypothetical protein
VTSFLWVSMTTSPSGLTPVLHLDLTSKLIDYKIAYIKYISKEHLVTN